MQKTTSPTIGTLVLSTIAITVILLSVAPSSIYQEGKAQTVRGTKNVQGTSLSGEVNCPAGTPNYGDPVFATLGFYATQSKNTFGGNFFVNPQTTAHPGNIQGDISSGHMSGRSFTLTGIEHDTMCTDELSEITTSFTLTGQCSGGTVTLTAGNGETGTFSGSVGCA